MNIKRRKLNVLIVDDDIDTVQSIVVFLKLMRISNVMTTDSAKEAIEKVYFAPIDIVIFGLYMKDLDGIELIRNLSDLPQSISLICINSQSEHLGLATEEMAHRHHINLLGTLHTPVKYFSLCSLLNKHQMKPYALKKHYDTLSLETELQHVIQNNSLSVLYQPQIDCHSECMVGIEALARWKHETMGDIPPDVFIPLAEKLGLMEMFTRQIYSKVLDDCKQVMTDNPSFTVSINFSISSLTDLRLPGILIEELEQRNLSPRQIIIEITESMFEKDSTTSLDILARIRLKGFGLSIDDFGIGYSTMERFNHIPFTELKMDQSFVHGAKKNKVKKAILESCVMLAKSLGIKTIAEGVENIDDLELVKQIGCDSIQGFYFAKPMSINALSDWPISNNKVAKLGI
ncbi:MAG: EAL domain-containing response regulator [Methylococcales bacterium]|nr:EAL domain-containing response regulator [Methylococcales bacterium]